MDVSMSQEYSCLFSIETLYREIVMLNKHLFKKTRILIVTGLCLYSISAFSNTITEDIVNYDIGLTTPNVHTNYKRSITLQGSFGIAFLLFVPEGTPLGETKKRVGEDVFDCYFPMRDYSAISDILDGHRGGPRQRILFSFTENNVAHISADGIYFSER